MIIFLVLYNLVCLSVCLSVCPQQSYCTKRMELAKLVLLRYLIKIHQLLWSTPLHRNVEHHGLVATDLSQVYVTLVVD
ncbi:hypothetical protein BDL97_13G055700 [Sphagnum fallax]|nr:hypothetical protein BDL97_13G055700 [Sphagnum fallax]